MCSLYFYTPTLLHLCLLPIPLLTPSHDQLLSPEPYWERGERGQRPPCPSSASTSHLASPGWTDVDAGDGTPMAMYCLSYAMHCLTLAFHVAG